MCCSSLRWAEIRWTVYDEHLKAGWSQQQEEKGEGTNKIAKVTKQKERKGIVETCNHKFDEEYEQKTQVGRRRSEVSW